MRPIYLTGATGTGKSSIATSIAERIGGEIINADACQLYRGIEIVTASPHPTDHDRAPHHLYGVLELSEDCNAARFSEMANQLIMQISNEKRVPIVVGGSGLYLKSLTHGLSELPPADNTLRKELNQLTSTELINRLHDLDPVGATQINLLNRRYVTRAVEISILADRPMSEIKTEWKEYKPQFNGVLLNRPRQELYDRIDSRVLKMIECGLLDEIKFLPQNISNTAQRAIGIREVTAHLEGETSIKECIKSIQKATRNYAKRQLSWFKREEGFQKICLEKKDDPDSIAVKITALFNLPEHV